MGTKTRFGLTTTGQRSTAYSPNMLSGITNRMNSIGDAGGILGQRDAPEGIPVVTAAQPIRPGLDYTAVDINSFMGGRGDSGLFDDGGGYIAPNSWDQDAYNKMLADLAAEEAAKKANTADNTDTLNSYEGLSDYFGGDAAAGAFNQAQGFDYLNSPYATGLVAMPGEPTPQLFPNGSGLNGSGPTSTTPALTPEQLAAQGRANLAAAAARKVTPLTDEQLYQQKEDFYGGLINRFDPRNSRGYGEIPAFLGAGSVEARDAAAFAASDAGIAAATAAEQKADLFAAQQASQATIDAAAAIQKQDDDFQTAVNAAGGMNKGTIGLVIDAAQDSFGGDTSRAIVTVIAEALKSGVTIDDLAAETGMAQADIVAAAKNASADPEASLTTSEIIDGGLNTAYGVVDKAIDLIEKGVEITGLEKVIDLAGNTVAKMGGLIPDQVKKVLVVNPKTGTITIQASNQSGGGILGNLPSSPYVRGGTTAGGTTYGIDTGNAVLNVLLGTIASKGSIDASDIGGLIATTIQTATGIPAAATAKVLGAAGDVVKKVATAVTGGEDDDDSSGTSVSFTGQNGSVDTSGLDTYINGEGGITLSDNTSGLGATQMGPLPTCPEGQTQINEPGDCFVSSSGITLSDNTSGLGATQMGPLPPCPEGQTQINEPGDCFVSGVASGGDSEPVITADTPCPNEGEIRDPVTFVCAIPVAPGGGGGSKTVVTADTPCPNEGEIRDPVTFVCAIPVAPGGGGVVITDDENVVCPPGTALQGQPVPADGNCDPAILLPPGGGGGDPPKEECPPGTALQGQTVPADGNCDPAILLPPGGGGGGSEGDECPAGQQFNFVTNLCEYTKVYCGDGFTLNIFTNQCEKDVKEDPPGDRPVVPPTTLGLPPRFVGEEDVLVPDPGEFQTPYSILPAPATDPYLGDRRSQDILNSLSSVGIDPSAGLDQSQESVDRFAQYANNFDIGIPELSDISGLDPSAFPSFEERYGISLPQIGTAPVPQPTLPIAGERYVPEDTALLPEIDPITGLPIPVNSSMFAAGGVVENGGGIESLLDRRQQAVNRMLTKRARGSL